MRCVKTAKSYAYSHIHIHIVYPSLIDTPTGMANEEDWSACFINQKKEKSDEQSCPAIQQNQRVLNEEIVAQSEKTK